MRLKLFGGQIYPTVVERYFPFVEASITSPVKLITEVVAAASAIHRARVFASSEDNLYPRNELPYAERFGEVIIGAGFQAHYFIDLLTPGGKH